MLKATIIYIYIYKIYGLLSSRNLSSGMESFSRHFHCYYSMQVRFRVRILILISTIYISSSLPAIWIMHGSDSYRAKVRRERTLNSGTFEFFRFTLSSPGDISTPDRVHRELYVVLAVQQSRIPYMYGKSSVDSIKYFRPVWLRIFRPFPLPSSPPPRIDEGPSGAPNIHGVSFKKVEEKF